MNKYLPGLLMLLSGFASLVYQVLWMRQLGLLFGNTSHAAAATLAAFFGGLAVGSWFWGRRSGKSANPMRAYAWLEAGIAVTALLYFAVLAVFHAVYPLIFQSVTSGAILLSVKFLLALLLVFPPAFLMGGTIPTIGQAVIRNRNEFGVRAARLYALNTVGAAAGAYAAAFLLVPHIGFRWTCFTAMCVTAVVALAAGLISKTPSFGLDDNACPTDPLANRRRSGVPKPKPGRKEKPVFAGKSISAWAVYVVCFLSGFGFLVLEVLWLRLLAQIHVNSVYSFSTVLVIVLAALAMGAAVASGIARLRVNPVTALASMLLLGGASIAISPFVFMAASNGISILDTGGSMADYLLGLLRVGSVVVGAPALILGSVFPFLMKIEEKFLTQAGTSIGRLSAINTIGAILGSLLCGFVFLGHLGLWRTMQFTAAMYLAAGMLLPIGMSKPAMSLRLAGAALLLLVFTALNPAALRSTGWNHAQQSERILEVWETSDCMVSVVEDMDDGLSIKVNSNYKLGSTGAAWQEHFQGRIPLLAFPETRNICFIGVGTGISVGGALDPRFESLRRVVACELIPEVITASKKYMTGASEAAADRTVDFTSGLFEDQRVEIVVQDGRHYLMASGETFDMINGDLFLPYQSGSGSLYSREHFENAKVSLNPGGVFVQWLPMYQLTEFEFGSIARTMLDVFPQVTIWRNNFNPGQEVVALAGHRDAVPLPACETHSAAARRMEVAGVNPNLTDKLNLTFDEETALVFYIGNITAVKSLFSHYPANTDDRPVIEYTSPLSMHKKEDGLIPTLVGPRYEAFIDRIQALCPPGSDPMLARRTPADRQLVTAGTELHRFWLAKAVEDPHKAASAWARFVRAWTSADASSQ